MKMLSLVAVLGASVTLGAQNPPAQKPAPVPVAVQGCVDRALPNAPSLYILIDAQAGGSSPVVPAAGRGQPPATAPLPKAPTVVEPRYWLSGPTTIDFAKHQNQRVEVIGIVTTLPDPKPGDKPLAPDAPKSMFQVHELKLLSTECKG